MAGSPWLLVMQCGFVAYGFSGTGIDAIPCLQLMIPRIDFVAEDGTKNEP